MATTTQADLDFLFQNSIHHFQVTTPIPEIIHLQINRPSKRNCFSSQTWNEYYTIIKQLSEQTTTKVIILSGQGPHFCSGIDVSELSNFAKSTKTSPTAHHKKLKDIENFQECISIPLRTSIPVIAITHGVSYGLAIDIIAACQIRLSVKDTRFSIKEIDVGIIADIGSLQRLPQLVNNVSVLTELAYTGREFNGIDAKDLGLVSSVFETKDLAFEYSLKLADVMRKKYSPALKGTKKCLDFMTNDTAGVNEGLKQVALENSQLMSDPSYFKFISSRFKVGSKL